jgi:hypothetical protein
VSYIDDVFDKKDGIKKQEYLDILGYFKITQGIHDFDFMFFFADIFTLRV